MSVQNLEPRHLEDVEIFDRTNENFDLVMALQKK